VQALADAGVPFEAYYYEDVSHNIQIGDNLNEIGAEMFYRILDFVAQYLAPASRQAVVD